MSKKWRVGVLDCVRRFFTLRLRLFSLFTALAVGSVIAVVFLGQQSVDTIGLSGQATELSKTRVAVEELKQALRVSAASPRQYLVTKSPRESKIWAGQVHVWQGLWAGVSPGYRQVRGDRKVISLGKRLDELQKTQARFFATEDELLRQKYFRKANLIQEQVEDDLIEVSKFYEARIDQILTDVAQSQASLSGNIKLAAVLFGSMAILLGLIAQRSLLTPLDELREGLKHIAAGKLDYQMKTKRLDVIGDLATEFNGVTLGLKKSFKDLKRRFSQLTNLYQISKAISATNDLDKLLNQVLKQSLDLMGAETGSIMLLAPEEDELMIRAAVGLDKETIEATRVKIGQGISGYVAEKGKPLMIQDGVRKAKLPGTSDVKDALSVPLIANEKIIGVINANNKQAGRFDKHDLRFFTTLAGQIATAVANATLVDDIQEAYFNTIKVLAAAIDAKDEYTHGHSARVAKFAVTIAKQLGLSKSDLTRIEAAAYLHDIGKIGVPDQVLNKDGALTEKERALINRHPLEASEILGHIDFPWGDVVPGVRGHHERPDGKGYPDGLKDEEISREARIIAVADSFDAMTSDRPYRKALDKTRAVTELVNGRGSQFDGQTVDAFIPALLSEWMTSMPGVIVDTLELITNSPTSKDAKPKVAVSSSDK